MIKIKISKNEYVLRIEPKEELFNSLLNFAKKEKIKSAFFYGIGATNRCILGRYNEKTKDYDWKEINEQMEICVIVGNLTFKEGKYFLHSHAVLSDKNFKAFGGHLKEIYAFPTIELFLTKINKRIERKYNELTNLFLIN